MINSLYYLHNIIVSSTKIKQYLERYF